MPTNDLHISNNYWTSYWIDRLHFSCLIRARLDIFDTKNPEDPKNCEWRTPNKARDCTLLPYGFLSKYMPTKDKSSD